MTYRELLEICKKKCRMSGLKGAKGNGGQKKISAYGNALLSE